MRGIMELGRSAYLRSEKLPHTMQHAIHGQQNEHPKSATKMGKNPPTVVQIFPFPSWEMPTTWMQRSLLSDISWMSMESCCKIGDIRGDISSDMNLPSRHGGSCDAAPKGNLEPKHDPLWRGGLALEIITFNQSCPSLRIVGKTTNHQFSTHGCWVSKASTGCYHVARWCRHRWHRTWPPVSRPAVPSYRLGKRVTPVTQNGCQRKLCLSIHWNRGLCLASKLMTHDSTSMFKIVCDLQTFPGFLVILPPPKQR